jgi:hypothetical protein
MVARTDLANAEPYLPDEPLDSRRLGFPEPPWLAKRLLTTPPRRPPKIPEGETVRASLAILESF